MIGNFKHLFIPISAGVGLTLLFLFLMGHTQSANANLGVLYVALDGDDGNTCGSSTNRCATLQRGVDVALPGDEIRVAAGVYTDISTRMGITQVVYISKTVLLQGGYTTSDWVTANPAAHPTILDAQGQGRVVVIRGAGPTIRGFVITGGGGYFSGGGINVENASPFIYNNQISGNSAEGDGGGIWVNRGFAEISNNRIFSNTANWAGGLRIINDADVLIISNRIEANAALISGGGIDIECCGGTIPLVSGNYIANNNAGTAGGGIWVRTAHARMVNNILVGNQAGSGAGFWAEGFTTHPVTATLLHNTFIGGIPGGEGVWSGAYVNATLLNNIIVGYGTGITNTTPVSSSVAVEYTLFYSNTADYGSGVSSINEVHGDPVFVNPAAGDYHLGSGSAAIDTGMNAGVADDFDGEPRPYGTGFDIGADEIVKQIYLPLLLRNGQP